jgi:hypothetical protein
MNKVQRNPSLVIIITLAIIVMALLYQLNSLNTQISSLKQELEESRSELDKLNQTCYTNFKEVLGKLDPEILALIANSSDEGGNRVFPLTITVAGVMGEEEIAELNQLGIGLVKVNETILKQGEDYLATGTVSSILQASTKEYLSKLKYGYDLKISTFFSGEILAPAFATFPEDAEITISPQSPTKGDLVEIGVTNMHGTKKIAFTLNLYLDQETGSNLVYSSAEGFDEGYRPVYIVLKPGASYEIQLSLKSEGEYFIGSVDLSFTV